MAKESPAPQESRAAADPPWKTFETAYSDYVRQLGEIWDGLTTRINEAVRGYSDAASKVRDAKKIEEVQAAYEAAQKDLVAAIRAAWDECQKRYADAYAHYLGTHRDAWTKTKAPDLSPEIVAAASQSAASAAAYAGVTIANSSLIAWAGIPPWVLSMPKSS